MRPRTTALAVLAIITTISASLFPARAPSAEPRTVEVESKALGRAMAVNVLLPDGYDAAPERRYPVIYLLHGYGGDYREWERVGVVEEAAGLAAIIVMPEGDQSFYVNHHEKLLERWEDYITQDVVGHVDASYRTIPGREGRGISGLSMGGYGAVVLGLRHPDLFASVASHSGALGVLRSEIRNEGIARRIAEIYGPEGSQARKDYAIYDLVRALPQEKRPHLYIDCGSQDFLLEDNRAFVKELSGLRVAYEYREVPGGHDFAYWKANVRYSLSRQLEALEALGSAAAVKPAPSAAADPAPAAASAESLAGTWEMVVQYGDEKLDYDLRLSAAGGKLEGVLVSPRSGEHKCAVVTWKDGGLHLEIDRDVEGMELRFVYDAKLSGGVLSGKISIKGLEDQFQGTFEAKKKPGAKL
jgi:S-formylglutathione hydrolase FrmB